MEEDDYCVFCGTPIYEEDEFICEDCLLVTNPDWATESLWPDDDDD